MTSVALVFRTIHERTSELALELAKKHIRPDEVHVLADCRPFSVAVQKMLAIEYKSEYVVAVDADSLIVEDMRPFLDANRQAYVDSYVHDRYRGRIHCGVHITRLDVIQAMRGIEPPVDDVAYVLRPESRLRKLALNRLGYAKCFKSFRIFHDHHQWLRDVWAKYALRELRSRTPEQRRKLDAALARWGDDGDVEHVVAKAAVAWAKAELPEDTPARELARAIARLPDLGAEHLASLGIAERAPLTHAEVEATREAYERSWPSFDRAYKVFGLGLSRTGTRSLSSALHVLGIDAVHYPIDADSLRAMTSGALDFQLLECFDGITDITVAPYFRDLERLHPDAKFVLTLREPEGWLRSCANHWSGRDAFGRADTEGSRIHMETRRFLRAATYGSYEFDAVRFRTAYDAHVDAVRRYFRDKPGKLLELDIVAGGGWDELCAFLGRPRPQQPFPHKGGVLTAILLAEVDDPDD